MGTRVAFAHGRRHSAGSVGALYYSREIPSLLKRLRLSKLYGRKGVISFESNVAVRPAIRRYTDAMRSVADDLRAESRRRAADLTPEVRMEQALDLGDADVAALCEARQLSALDARALIRQHRRVGRRPSRAHDG